MNPNGRFFFLWLLPSPRGGAFCPVNSSSVLGGRLAPSIFSHHYFFNCRNSPSFSLPLSILLSPSLCPSLPPSPALPPSLYLHPSLPPPLSLSLPPSLSPSLSPPLSRRLSCLTLFIVNSPGPSWNEWEHKSKYSLTTVNVMEWHCLLFSNFH